MEPSKKGKGTRPSFPKGIARVGVVLIELMLLMLLMLLKSIRFEKRIAMPLNECTLGRVSVSYLDGHNLLRRVLTAGLIEVLIKLNWGFGRVPTVRCDAFGGVVNVRR